MKRRPLSVVLAGETRQLQTAGGIFSPDGVDKGTIILLNEAPPPATEGNLLDIGCGWGPIALTLALRSPETTVYAVDVNERSIELTRDNAKALGLANVKASTPDAVDPDIRFNTIWSNPPCRQVGAALDPVDVAAAPGSERKRLPCGAKEPWFRFIAAVACG